MGQFVRLEQDGAVGVIRLDRPPVNAINSVIHRELLEIAREIDGRPELRAVVIYGGPRAFAAGADIREMADLGPEQIRVFGRNLTSAIDAVARLRVPVVAAVTGYALGGGCELALAADFRVVAQDAQLGLPEVTLGVMPGAGGTQRLPRLIGVSAAKQMIFSGEPVSGDEAFGMGLASIAVPADQVFPIAMGVARKMAGGATRAIAAAKQAIDEGMELGLPAGLELEGRLFADLFTTEDQKNGMSSFLQAGPGKATFTGR